MIEKALNLRSDLVWLRDLDLNWFAKTRFRKWFGLESDLVWEVFLLVIEEKISMRKRERKVRKQFEYSCYKWVKHLYRLHNDTKACSPWQKHTQAFTIIQSVTQVYKRHDFTQVYKRQDYTRVQKTRLDTSIPKLLRPWHKHNRASSSLIIPLPLLLKVTRIWNIRTLTRNTRTEQVHEHTNKNILIT